MYILSGQLPIEDQIYKKILSLISKPWVSPQYISYVDTTKAWISSHFTEKAIYTCHHLFEITIVSVDYATLYRGWVNIVAAT